MRRSIRSGINRIRSTCGLLNKNIPITAGTMLASIMTRIFIMPTIAARGEVGTRDFMVSVLGPRAPAAIRRERREPLAVLEPTGLAAIPVEPPVLEPILLEPPALAGIHPEPLARA